jgi:hypothetical protein
MSAKTPNTGKIPSVNRLFAKLQKLAQRCFKRSTVTKSKRYTAEELDVRLRFIGGLVLFAVFACAMFSILYDLNFVEQPMAGMAPADKALVEVLKMMVSFLAGVLTRVFDKGPSMNQYRPTPCPGQMTEKITISEKPAGLQVNKPAVTETIKVTERPEL